MKICKYCKKEVKYSSNLVFLYQTKKGKDVYGCRKCVENKQREKELERLNMRA
jgi:hypothetical protein